MASLLDVGRHGPPFWPFIAARVAETIAETSNRGAVVVAMHSNAGLFAPHIATTSPKPVDALIFVDASIPPDEGEADVVPPEFLAELRAKAQDGLVPRWTDWWTEEDVAPLFPDPATRRRVIDEQPRLPLTYYEQRIPIEPGWTSTPCGYLLFGPPYDEFAEQARVRGWPVVEASGQHLHMVVDPEGVGRALLELAKSLHA